LSLGIREKDKLVERYEIEIRRRNDEIERKQSEVDRLNKKYDSLMSNMKDENMGPLEATIHNLSNEISKKGRECSELQYYWLRSQTELVNLNKCIEREQEDNQVILLQVIFAENSNRKCNGSSVFSDKSSPELMASCQT
jgi:predicted RNase H-like nuclease (RuvC/YqgF family)